MSDDHDDEVSFGLQTLNALIDKGLPAGVYVKAVDIMPISIVIVDEFGHIVVFNSKAEFVFKYHRTEVLGRRLEMLMPERYREAHARHFQAMIADPRSRQMGVGMEIFGLRKSDAEFPADIFLGPFQVPEGLFFVAVVIDLSTKESILALHPATPEK